MKTVTRRVIIGISLVILIAIGNFKVDNIVTRPVEIKKISAKAYSLNNNFCSKKLLLDKNKDIFDKYTKKDFMFAISKEGNIYYVDKDGVIKTGIVRIGMDTYYFNDEGIMQKGVINIEGNNYIFNEENGKLQSDLVLRQIDDEKLFD